MRHPDLSSRPARVAAALVLSTAALGFAGTASALPLSPMASPAAAAPSPIETVQWRGGWGGPGWGGPGWGGPAYGWRGYGWRGGWGPGYPGWGWNRPVVVGPAWGAPGWGWGPGGCGWGGCGWGPGAGFATGVIVGSAIAAPPPVVYAAPPGNAVAYCMRRFKSYNPATGTYLGYDGRRHRCP